MNTNQEEAEYHLLRERMVREQLLGRDIRDRRVLAAMSRVPRHRFIPPNLRYLAYQDTPVPIGMGQTISQPYVVAMMTQAITPGPEDRVLEIGTGSGYQTAVLAEIVKHVYTIELNCQLARVAGELLLGEGYENISARCGDGYRGWPEHAPFDAVLVAAAPPYVPEELVKQLKTGGRMIIPVGDLEQSLRLIHKHDDQSVSEERLLPVRFVPMLRSD